MLSRVQRLSSAGARTGQIRTLRRRIGLAHSRSKDAATLGRARRKAPVAGLARLKHTVAHFGGCKARSRAGIVLARRVLGNKGCTNWRASQRSSRLTSSTPKTSVALIASPRHQIATARYDLTNSASPVRCSSVDFSRTWDQIAFRHSVCVFARWDLNRGAEERDRAGRFSTTRVTKVILGAHSDL